MATNTQQPQGASPAPAMLSPEQVVQQLRALREQIPLPEALPAMPAARRRRLAHVDSQFVIAAINASGASPAVQTALGRTDEELRQESDASSRWTAVIDEVRALLQSLLDANLLRRQRVGLAALQTYKICQQLARDDTQATRLAAHISRSRSRIPSRRRSIRRDHDVSEGLRACRGTSGVLLWRLSWTNNQRRRSLGSSTP